MKQKIYWIGIISIIITILGSLFKMMHFPGAAILLGTGFSGLIFIFFPVGLVKSYRKEGKKEYRLLYIITYITLFIVFTGMFFKIVHLPGAGKLLFTGLLFPYIIFLPVFLVTTSKIENYSIYNTVKVLLLLAFVSVFNSLLALNVAKEKLDDSLYLASLYHNTAVLKEAGDFTPSTATQGIYKSAGEALEVIGEVKEKILAKSGSGTGSFGTNRYSLRYADSRSLPGEVLLTGGNPTPGERLESCLENFLSEVESAGNKRITKPLAADLLDFEPTSEYGISWIELKFSGNWTSWSLAYLTMLENNIILLRDELIYQAGQ